MSSLSITCGVLLILLGIGGYVYGMTNGAASPTALIPAAFGIIIAAMGAVGSAKPDLRKHVMHVAVLVALIGFLIPAIRLLSKLGSLTMSAAVVSQAVMAVICLLFVIFAVRSFVSARRGV
jgi:hypothetical protein